MPERGVWGGRDSWWGVKLGYEIDATLSKRTKVKERHSSIKDLFDQYTSIKQLGVLTFNIIDRFELYGLIGAMKLRMVQRPIDRVRLAYETSNQCIGGIGGRFILVYWEEVIMGFNARYNHAHLNLDHIIQNGRPIPTGRGSFHYDEWQVGASFSREIGIFIPYIGLSYAYMSSGFHQLPNRSPLTFCPEDEEIENWSPFIFLVGVGLSQGKAVNFNIETRMVGEVGLTVSGDLRF
jgi:major outer membrane protein